MRYPRQWRYTPPADTEEHYLAEVPDPAYKEFKALISAASDGCPDGKQAWEDFQRAFCEEAGGDYWPSSDSFFARQDTDRYMSEIRHNLPRFIDAFVRGRDSLDRGCSENLSDGVLNALMEAFHIGYVIDGDTLRLRGTIAAPELVKPEGWESAWSEVENAVHASRQAIDDGNYRRAAREVSWVLESLATDWTGTDVEDTTIDATYFPQIASQVRKADRSSFLAAVLGAMERLYGDASDPSKGGVRHGISKDARKWERHEAEFIVNVALAAGRYLAQEQANRSSGS